ncbi:MAG: hypothetical protein LUG84_08600 [Akkermansiaceae bacterium]|nr:hypothetical protein [Akkermansiaceae bacterium]
MLTCMLLLGMACGFAHCAYLLWPSAGSVFFYTLCGPSLQGGEYILLNPGEAPPNELRSVPAKRPRDTPPASPVIHLISLDPAQVESSFASSPISPLDLAVLLDGAAKAGTSAAGLSLPFAWDETPEPLALETLRQKINALPKVVLGLQARTLPRPEFLPKELEGEGIPAAQVDGDISLFPSANAAMPGRTGMAQGGETVSWAVDRVDGDPLMQEGMEDGRSLPLFVRWHSDVYPTLPLRLAWKALGVQIAEVRLKAGESLSWRNVSLPLDDRGRIRLNGEERCEFVSVSDLVEGRYEGKGGTLLLCEPESTANHAEARMLKLGRTLSRLLTPAPEATASEAPPPVKTIIYLRRGHVPKGLGAILLLAAGFLYLMFTPAWRPGWHALLDLALLTLGAQALGSLAGHGLWLPVAPWCALYLILLAETRILRFFRPVIRRTR